MSFGVQNDWFGLSDTNYRTISSGKEPFATNAQALDSNGDVSCETVFDTGYVYRQTLRLATGTTVNLDTICKVGDLLTGDTSELIVTNLTVSTSNTERPTLEVTGEKYYGDSADVNTYSSSLSITLNKTAQALGMSADTGSALTACRATISSQIAKAQDSAGQTVAMDVYQGRIECQGELTSCASTPGASADTSNGYAEMQPVSLSEDNTGYETATYSTYQNLSPDT